MLGDWAKKLEGVQNALGSKVEEWNLSEKINKSLPMSGDMVQEHYELKGRKFMVEAKIAEGGFAYVFVGRDSATGKRVAIKRIRIQTPEHMGQIKNEVNIHRKISSHENILEFIDAAVYQTATGKAFCIFTELCDAGTVLDIMNKRANVNRRLTEKEIFTIFRQVCEGVRYMHSQDPPIAHRDLKVENVLLNRRGVCKVCDFGSATTRVSQPSTNRERVRAETEINKNTTLFCRAPEMVDLWQGKEINEQVDVWALGCMMFKMAFYKDAFDSKLGIMNAKFWIPGDSVYSSTLHGYIKYLLNPDPEERPTIFKLLTKMTGTEIKRPLSSLKSRSKKKTTRASPKPQQSKGSKDSEHKTQPKRSASTPVQSNNSDDVNGGGLFGLLDWHDNSTKQLVKPAQVDLQERNKGMVNVGGKSQDDLNKLFDPFGNNSTQKSSTVTTQSKAPSSGGFLVDFGSAFEQNKQTKTETAPKNLMDAPRSNGAVDFSNVFGQPSSATTSPQIGVDFSGAFPSPSESTNQNGTAVINTPPTSQGVDLTTVFAPTSTPTMSPALNRPPTGNLMTLYSPPTSPVLAPQSLRHSSPAHSQSTPANVNSQGLRGSDPFAQLNVFGK